MHDPNNDIKDDALTHFLTRTHLQARIFMHRSYCEEWAIDIAGTGQVPFYLVDNGQAWIHMDGMQPRLIQAGDLVMFPHDSHHVLANSQKPQDRKNINQPKDCVKQESLTSVLCGFYEFESVAAQLLLNDMPDIVLLTDARNNPTTDGIAHVLDTILIELKNNNPGRNIALRDLARLLRNCFSANLSQGYLKALITPQIGHALQLIHTRFNEEWTLEELARTIGMSRTAFAQKFHEYVGMPPVKYLTSWRMQEATNLLTNTTLSIEKIAGKCGYQSAASFRKSYKSFTGNTPRQLRKKSRDSFISRARRRILRSEDPPLNQ
ncbi:MAG: AraC family transcriptional regulator [Candidatus Thiodiazotropha weberae]|nr:AraC family transcriptional regulator [Candidatus Thiodiazotropha lotti]MCG8011917.1 AraC family transcriptional regulator [Candidatus Thiodiazotropha lotti]MCG8021554.1 AraC family transcriptional regulator [Candidatus Thiodiazotropha lotti]MCW4208722.1 AraC family transcriptional regulator [Candidatus Thiodiazotropha lotti]MCW4211384.1 AraC family transcriptional regulator [Candidatus Thiodiazotropha lotti]